MSTTEVTSDNDIRTQDIMVNKSVKLRPRLIDWFRQEAVRNHTNVSTEIRRWLELAYKYREAIAAVEAVPVRFVKDVSR